MMRTLLLLPFFLIHLDGSAQSRVSLLKDSLARTEPGTDSYFSIYNELIHEYVDSNPDSALLLCKQLLTMTEGKGSVHLAKTYYSFSLAYHYQAKYDSSTYYSFQSVEQAEVAHDTLLLIAPLNNIGVNFLYQEDYENAKKYFLQVATLSEAIQNSRSQAHAFNNLGMVEGYQGNEEEELRYYQKSADLFSELNDADGLGNAILNSGTVYTTLGAFEKANLYYDSALVIYEKAAIHSGMVAAILSKAENYLAKGDYPRALKEADKATNLAIKHRFTQDEIYGYELLTQIFTEQGDYRKAVEYQQKYYTKKEEIFSLERSRQIRELETKYETEKKELEIATLTAQNEQQQQEKQSLLVIFSLLGVISLSIIFIFYQRNRQNKLKHQLLNEEIEGLRLRISRIYSEVKLSEIETDLKKIQAAFHNDLSEREAEILQLAVTNKTNAEIADSVHISVNTVKYHLKNIYSKIGVSSRLEARQVMTES